MRARLVALLSILLLAPLSGVPASASDREIPGPSLPEQASQTAREHAEAALARAQALFEERSPAAQRQRAGHGRDATMILNEVLRTRGDLSPADQKRAAALLARPTGDPAFENEVQYDPSAEVKSHCGDKICIHYVTSTADAPPLTDGDTNGVPDTVEDVLATAEDVNNTYEAAGYRRPDPDGTLGGGSDLVDIYLADIGDDGLYGYCTSDEPDRGDGTWNLWAYCAIDDDFAQTQFPAHTPLQNQQVTLAHEYFHAVQYAYDAFEDPWFLEATATWAEEELFDGVNDNRQYLQTGQLGAPGVPLDMADSSFPSYYGNWIFFRYLTERWSQHRGSMPKLMLELMRSVSGRAGDPDRYSTQAIQRALAKRRTSFTEVYGQFADANRRPAKVYDEGNARAYRAARPAKTFRLKASKRRTGGWSAELYHLTNLPVRFKPGRGTTQKRWRLRINVNMPASKTAPVARVAVFLKNGKVQSRSIRLNRKTKGKKVVPFSKRKVKYVDLVLVNASRRSQCWNSSPLFACYGTPKDDLVKTRFSATAFKR